MPVRCLTPWDHQTERIYGSENAVFPSLFANTGAWQNRQAVLINNAPPKIFYESGPGYWTESLPCLRCNGERPSYPTRVVMYERRK